MFDFLARWFKSGDQSKNTAKERLRLVLVHDRASVSPGLMESMREDLIAVFSKYLEIEEAGLEVNFDHADDSVALVANIPVKRVKRND